MCGCGCSGKEKGIESQTRGALEECYQPQGPQRAKEVNPCLNGVQQYGQVTQTPRAPCIGEYERHLYEQQEGDICDKDPKDPYQIPGYAGHVPTLQSRSGGTFGHDTHEVLSAIGSKNPPSFGQGGHICPAPMHEPYRLPGYTGHVPGLQFLVGGAYGPDTHKLLYSQQPPPNRQENLSPYRNNQVNQAYGSGEANDNYYNTSSTNSYSPNANGHASHNPHGNSNMTSSSEPTGGQMTVYQKPDEHYYKPQYKYRIGDTFATTRDITLVDPCVNTQSKVVVSTRELDDTQVVRTADTLEERMGELPFIYQPIRHRPMVPGFDTFIDAMRGARGQRYEFSDLPPSHMQLQQQLVLERGGIKESQTPENGISSHTSNHPVSVSCDGNIPFGYGKNALQRQPYTNSALYDFTSNYRRRQSSEWAPATMSRPDPPAFDIPGEIYSQHTGLLPGYSAHVPGAMFRCGKNFTDDSRDAKRALRGDRF